MKRQVILISGLGKSGTHLMSRLFDKHPDVAVYPQEFHFLRAALEARGEVTELKALLLKKLSNVEGVSGFTIVPLESDNGVSYLEYGANRYSFDKYFDRDAFFSEVSSIEAQSVADLFFEFSDIYFKYWGIDSTKKSIIIKMPNRVEESYFVGKKYFDSFRVLFMKRNPVSVYASRKRVNSTVRGPFVALKFGASYFIENEFSRRNLLQINFSEVTQRSLYCLNKVCDFLCIERFRCFPEELTLMGLKWSGDSSKRNGVESTAIKEGRTSVKPQEKFGIFVGNSHFGAFLYKVGRATFRRKESFRSTTGY